MTRPLLDELDRRLIGALHLAPRATWDDIGGILGAKATQLLVEGWPMRVPWWVIFDPKAGGKALFGGLLVGWICVLGVRGCANEAPKQRGRDRKHTLRAHENVVARTVESPANRMVRIRPEHLGHAQ